MVALADDRTPALGVQMPACKVKLPPECHGGGATEGRLLADPGLSRQAAPDPLPSFESPRWQCPFSKVQRPFARRGHSGPTVGERYSIAEASGRSIRDADILTRL